MTITKSYITIKGTKDGLVFNMDDTCSYQDLILELTNKLESNYQAGTSTPVLRVMVRLGNRYVSEEQELEIRNLIRSKGNLLIDKLESNVVHRDTVEQAKLRANIQVISKTIRSGQLFQLDGNVLILGDVNPGGCVQASGSIFVLGALRGTAHAGFEGDKEAIVAASLLKPTQLRIAEKVSRPPDEWEEEEYQMEFAYIEDEQIVVEKLHHLSRIRPGMNGFI